MADVRRSRQQGFTLIAAAVSLTAVLGMTGLAVDLGRIYIARNEAQVFADAAALAAALEMDSTRAGLTRAAVAVSNSRNRWNIGTARFTGTAVEFAETPQGGWQDASAAPVSSRYVRVTASVTLPLYLLPVVSRSTHQQVRASAAAAQLPRTSFASGLLPFTLIAHDDSDPAFGFTVGEKYTMRWPASPKVNKNLCSGDNAEQWLNKSGANMQGYYQETSNALLVDAVMNGFQSAPLAVGDSMHMVGGTRAAEADALTRRVNEDTDITSSNYAAYSAVGRGNGRRLVVMPVNSGSPDYIVRGFGAFLLPMTYEHTGNSSWCAEFVGAYVMGSARGRVTGAGAYMVRLVQ